MAGTETEEKRSNRDAAGDEEFVSCFGENAPETEGGELCELQNKSMKRVTD